MGARPSRPVRPGFLERHRITRAVIGVLVVLAYVFCYLGLSDLVALVAPRSDRALSSIVAGAVFSLCSYWCYHNRMYGIEPARRVRRDTGWKHELAGWTAAFVAISVVLQGIFIFVFSRAVDPGMVSRAEAIENSDAVLLTVLSLFLAPVCEELVFRVFCYNFLKRMWGMVPSMIITSLLFGIVHGTIAHIVSATMLGVFSCIAYEFTGRWYISIIGHFVYNTMSVFFLTEVFYNESTKFPFFVVYCLVYVVTVTVLMVELTEARRLQEEEVGDA